MKDIEHFMLPENTNSLYTKEAISSISLTREVADKINELIDAYNKFSKTDLAWKQEQEGIIRKGVLYMKDNLVNTLNDLMKQLTDSGFVDRRIQDILSDIYSEAEALATRLDGIVGNLTIDSEIIDARVDANGVTQPSAGAQVRKVEKLVNGILSNSFNVYQALNWIGSKAINTSGNIYTAGNPNFKVASIRLNKGTTVSYKLYSNASLPVIATGDEDNPITIINSVPVTGDASTPVIGNYTVNNESEVLWFSTTKIQDVNAYIKIAFPRNDLIGWVKGYMNVDGIETIDNVYGLSSPIFVPSGCKISAVLMASDAVSAICKCDETGSFISNLRRGKNGAIAQTYSYYATEDCYVRVCSRINGSGSTMSVANVNIKVEEMEKFYRPIFTVGNGHINVADQNVKNDGVYMYSDLIYLDKGMTIHFFSSGSSAMYALSEWNDSREFVEGIVVGNTRHREITFTAPKDMIVRISAKKVQSGSEAVTTEEEFTAVKIYMKDKYYNDVKNSNLYNKSITFFGDSLAYGNIIGQDATWCHLLALKYNMSETNLGINGNSVAVQSVETTNLPMVSRVGDIPDSDYIVVIGGANDKRLNVPIDSFKSALVTIIDRIREEHSKSKLLFLTNYNRFPDSANSLGLNDIDYVDAMREVCASKGVKCFDNYRESGVTFADWFDEGVTQGIGANKHISREGYKWLLPIYENIIRGM